MGDCVVAVVMASRVPFAVVMAAETSTSMALATEAPYAVAMASGVPTAGVPAAVGLLVVVEVIIR